MHQPTLKSEPKSVKEGSRARRASERRSSSAEDLLDVDGDSEGTFGATKIKTQQLRHAFFQQIYNQGLRRIVLAADIFYVSGIPNICACARNAEFALCWCERF